MRLKLHMTPSEGIPHVRIPNRYMWDFAEYLGFHRVRVTYTHFDGHFVASFSGMDRPRVQGLLDDWIAGAARPEPAVLCAN